MTETTARGVVDRFGQIVRQRQASEWDAGLTDADQSGIPEIQGIAKRLRPKYEAVQAALSCEWLNGPTEGPVNRLKRQMVGRAKFGLLRARVLPMALGASRDRPVKLSHFLQGERRCRVCPLVRREASATAANRTPA